MKMWSSTAFTLAWLVFATLGLTLLRSQLCVAGVVLLVGAVAVLLAAVAVVFVGNCAAEEPPPPPPHAIAAKDIVTSSNIFCILSAQVV